MTAPAAYRVRRRRAHRLLWAPYRFMDYALGAALEDAGLAPWRRPRWLPRAVLNALAAVVLVGGALALVTLLALTVWYA